MTINTRWTLAISLLMPILVWQQALVLRLIAPIFLPLVSRVVAALSGLDFVYSVTTNSYYNQATNININEGCSGAHYFLMLLMVGLWMFGAQRKWLAFLGSAMLAYLVTMIANTGRILMAILIHQRVPSDNILNTATSHNAQGAFCFVVMLMLYVWTLEFINNNNILTIENQLIKQKI